MIGILQAQDGAGMTENLQVIGRMKMSLQFIIGSSGSGKSCYAYQNIIEQAGLHPEKLFYVIVPEQFTMQTQKTLVEMSPGRGILNIDPELCASCIPCSGGSWRRQPHPSGRNW